MKSSETYCTILYLQVPVAYSLRNIGLSKGKASMTDWAGPNMAEMSTMVTAPKWE